MEAGELLIKQNYDSAFALLDTDRQERVTRMKQEKNKALCMAAGLLSAYVLAEYRRERIDSGGITGDISDISVSECLGVQGNEIPVCNTHVCMPQAALSIVCVSISQIFDSLSGSEPLVIAKKAKGKPYFKDFPDVYFNISHSGDYVACMVSDREVGVDIQEYREIKGKALANKVLHEEEWVLSRAESALKEDTQIESAESGHLQQKRLLQLWAAKEAFVKCTGDGLSKDFKELCVDFAAGEVIDTVSGKRLRLMMVDALEGYALAVCVEK